MSASSEDAIKSGPGISLELERLRLLSREQLAETLAQSAAELKGLKEELRGAELENRYLRELLRLARIEKYGPEAKNSPRSRLTLLELEPRVSQAEVEAESERAQLKLPLRRGNKQDHSGRQELPAHLPRMEKIIPCTPEQCVCAQCGKQKELIGYESSEQLDVEPAKHFVLVTKREKRACRRCEELGAETAPAPARIIPKSVASDRVIIEHDRQQILRSPAVVSPECDAGTGNRIETLPSYDLRLGHGCR